jgi:hypothetical protein
VLCIAAITGRVLALVITDLHMAAISAPLSININFQIFISSFGKMGIFRLRVFEDEEGNATATEMC